LTRGNVNVIIPPMTSNAAQDIVFAPDLMAYVDSRVAAGQGRSVSEVVHSAIRLQRHESRVDQVSRSFLLRLDERLRMLNEPRQALDEAISMLGEHLGVDRVGSAWIDDDDNCVVEAEWTAANMPGLRGRRSLNNYGPLFLAALRQGRTVAFDDTRAASLMEDEGVAAAFAVGSTRAVIAVPLVKRGRLRACFYVHQKTPRAWTESDEGVVRDVAERTWAILERARTEAALRESEQRFHELADNISQFTWTADASGWIYWYNKRWHDYTGLTLEQTKGWGWTAIHHPDHIGRVMETFPRALRAGEPWEDTFPLRSKTGEYRWFLTRVLPIRDDQGHVVRWFGTNTDVTALREAKAALTKLNNTLESRVEEEVAARAKSEDTLRQSQKMEAVGQLTGGIAHDFNNLLQSMSGSLEIVQARAAQGRMAEVDRFVSVALTSVQRASALTQRLLAFSRRRALDPKPVDVNLLVAGMEDMIRRTVGPAIKVEAVLPGELWPTWCDAHQLENALLNLAINARDAMPEGGHLTIETANAYLDGPYAASRGGGLEPGQYVSVSVTDTGTGMPAEVAKRAFEPFFTTKLVGQGTGLGLSMLYGFAKQSNGHARIESEQGQGTTVLLYLPRDYGIGAEPDEAAGDVEQTG
jgi:PAS domain S-box-containing protein